MTKATQYGTVKDGVLKIINIKRFKDDLRQFDDCEVEVIVKKKGKRSSQQNRYYFGVVIELIRIELLRRGNRFDAEDIHEWAKLKFNPSKIEIEATGELVEIGSSTTEMNKSEFMEYVERIREWAAMSLEINIPDPGEQTQLFAA
jgi:hypothetical protein